jgi:hypothetical protein
MISYELQKETINKLNNNPYNINPHSTIYILDEGDNLYRFFIHTKETYDLIEITQEIKDVVSSTSFQNIQGCTLINNKKVHQYLEIFFSVMYNDIYRFIKQSESGSNKTFPSLFFNHRFIINNKSEPN